MNGVLRQCFVKNVWFNLKNVAWLIRVPITTDVETPEIHGHGGPAKEWARQFRHKHD